MSSTGGSDHGGGTKPFYCHKCECRVNVPIEDSSDPFCPICLQGFLEEQLENPNPNLFADTEPFGFDPFSLLPLLLSSASRSRNQPDFDDSDIFDPVNFLQNHLRDLQADGANVQFEINHPYEQGFRLPNNIGDYFLGPGLEQLIQQLAENDPNRYGTPPASKSAIQNLPTITVTDELLNSEMNQCAVCQDEFEKGSQVRQMPCKHVYHDGCLLPWLELHNSCPVCRYELPTDDPNYENPAHRAQGNANAGWRSLGSASSSGGGSRPVQRTFRISLRYPFGSRESSQENSERGWGKIGKISMSIVPLNGCWVLPASIHVNILKKE
ncbi:E3 ubiquitin-protein ligase RING1-like [Senna tora]|uniref:RING-type E3 ubiquitin transferase n=1 Tax=Senna tora TaxID=362788 RepID=A0A834SR72_9FABA|nr:E3 ubiquitin-protein ligase RING1-like [Senna tora]